MIGRKLKFTKSRFGLVVLFNLVGIFSAVVLFASSGASAIQPNCDGGPYMDYGRYKWCGYFTNDLDTSGLRLWNNGVPASVGATGTALQKVDELINFIVAERGGTVNGIQGQTSAEFVIDTMEGLTPTSNPTNSRGEAWTLEADWAQKLELGVTNGIIKINYFQNVNWHCGQEDTYYQVAPNDVAFYTTVNGGETPNCGPAVTVPAIVITDAKTGALIYEIKRICGNPFGTINALPNVNFVVVPSGFVTNTQVPVGGQDTLHVHLVNNGPAVSTPGTLQVGAASPAGGTAFYGSIVDPCAAGPPCTPATQSTLSNGVSTGDAFWKTTKDANFTGAARVPDWWWTTKSMTDGQVTDGTVAFTIPATSPLGTMTFNVCYEPTNEDGAGDCVPVTVTIVSERSTLVVSENGDVHAGGGLCGKTQTAGKVEGNGAVLPASSSYTQYVVSATDNPGGIADFGSNQSVSGSAKDTLDLGSNGGYEEVCREDLLSAAEAYEGTPGAAYTSLGGNSAANPYNLGTMAGLYFVNGTSYFKGTVNSKTTIVQTTGQMNIVGNITLTTNPFLPTQVPSLGVIAANNILIDSSVTQVDAYLFADGYIDTCVEGQSSKTACTNNLTVDGFLMGNTIEFHRIGPTNTNGAQVAETIILTPQIYLNPPQFFDASVDNVQLQGQGEEQPLF